MYKTSLFLFLVSFALIANTFASEKECFETNKNCAEVDIDSPKAKQAYQTGCAAKDAYSCYRLGQFYEVKKRDLVNAANYYEISCKGEDKNGCESLQKTTQELCYIKQKKKFCGKQEPIGEYRVFAYLQKFDPKYANAFAIHNFDASWTVKDAKALYEKRKKEKNPKLLEALRIEFNSKRHDGADAEGLDYDLQCMKSKCPDRNFE